MQNKMARASCRIAANELKQVAEEVMGNLTGGMRRKIGGVTAPRGHAPTP